MEQPQRIPQSTPVSTRSTLYSSTLQHPPADAALRDAEPRPVRVQLALQHLDDLEPLHARATGYSEYPVLECFEPLQPSQAQAIEYSEYPHARAPPAPASPGY